MQGAVGVEPTTLSLYLWDTPPYSLSSPVNKIPYFSVCQSCRYVGKCQCCEKCDHSEKIKNMCDEARICSGGLIQPRVYVTLQCDVKDTWIIHRWPPCLFHLTVVRLRSATHHNFILWNMYFKSNLLSSFRLAILDMLFKYILNLDLRYSCDFWDWFNAFSAIESLLNVFDYGAHIIWLNTHFLDLHTF